jgi:replicative DNA helicase
MTDLDPERALLGTILHRPKTLRDIDGIEAADFAQPRHAALWDLVQWMDSQRITPEPVAVAQHLHRINLPGVDALWIADLATDAPSWQPPHIYARLIRDNATRRRLIAAGTRIVQLAEAGEDPQEVQEMARAEVDAASRTVADIDYVGATFDATLEAWESPAPPSIPTPWPDLNRLIGGWRPGAMYVIGARPSVGKSIMGLQAARGLAEHGPTAFHSLEMPAQEIHTRLAAMESGVSMQKMDTRTLDEGDWSRIARVIPTIKGMPLAVDDRGSVRVVDIRSVARTLSRRGPLAGIVVDFLQLMTPARGDRRPRHEQVGDWSRSMKLLAKDFDIPVIVLSQLNRAVTERADARPMMSDLKASGDIEQDADVILLLHTTDEHPEDLHVLVAKNRQGQRGPVQLVRRGHVARVDSAGWSPSDQAG